MTRQKERAMQHLLQSISVVVFASLTWIDKARGFCKKPAKDESSALISCSASASGTSIKEDR